MSDVPVQSVKKALDLLSILVLEGPEEGIGLSELARRMGFPRSSVHHLLKTMTVCGFVAQRPDATYVAGPKCRRIGRLNRLRFGESADLVLPVLRDFAEHARESIVMTSLAAGRRVEVAHVDCDQPIRVDRATVEAGGIYRLPTGRVLIAHADPDEVDDVIEINGWPDGTWQGIGSRDALEAACQAVREAGHAAVAPDGGDLVSLAAPVWDREGAFVGALGTYAPRFRCGAEAQEKLLAALKRAAARLSRAL